MTLFMSSFTAALTPFLLLMLSFTAVSVVTPLQAQTRVRDNDDNISQAYARQRAALVSEVNYQLAFKFFDTPDQQEQYWGKSTISFKLNKRLDLTVDFTGDNIISFKINGSESKNYQKRQGHLLIPVKALSGIDLQAPITVEIEFNNKFGQTGDGIMRSVDPEDQAVYIATDFEPYQAHTFFPCFDQPDLKATYQITVDVPKKWKAISNELIDSATTTGERQSVTFKTTPKISTYLVFVAAGPYHEWKDEHRGIPLYLYARQSLTKHVDVERIHDTTKKGLDFFADYFGTPYPFSKYGQIFIPEFSWGGMENPGAVALNERNIFRGPVATSRYEGRDGLILHEMAHMWFGDLVTMQWWDDLWLNESFASYLAAMAQERAMKQTSAWIEFASDKNWGYWQDQLPTTHPIEGKVIDTRSTRGNFDGITYAKGAASLKQLHYTIGDEAFKKGLQSYFQEFAFKNTKRADFTQHLAKASGMKLDNWVSKWLQSAGPHRIDLNFSCRDGKVTTMQLKQSKNVAGVYSPHRTQIALYKKEGEKLIIGNTLAFVFEQANNPVVQAIGLNCPDFVFANLGDYDYALYALDEQSLEQAPAALKGAIDDTLTRLQLWSMLHQMVRDQKFSVHHYLTTALQVLEVEKDPQLLAILLGKYSSISSQFNTYLTPEERRAMAPSFEELLLKLMKDNRKNKDLSLLYFDFYLSIATSDQAAHHLLGVLKDNEMPNGEELGQERRWQIITLLAARGEAGAMALIEKESTLDKSADGERQAFAARVSIPQKESKKKYWEELKFPERLGQNKFQEGAGEFHQVNHPEHSLPFVADYLARARTLPWPEHDTLVDTFFGSLFPGHLCSQALLKDSSASMRQAKHLSNLAKRAWVEANHELDRCIKVRAYQASGKSK